MNSGKWILFMLLMLDGHEDRQVWQGPFDSETECYAWVKHYNSRPRPSWIGKCMTWEEFHRRWPEARAQGET